MHSQQMILKRYYIRWRPLGECGNIFYQLFHNIRRKSPVTQDFIQANVGIQRPPDIRRKIHN